MDFELHFILFVGAVIINFFLFWIASVGFYMVKEALKDSDCDSAVLLFCWGCIFSIPSFGFQCFVLANWLKSFY